MRQIWSPTDYRETVAAIRALAEQFPREVGESELLAELVDREVMGSW